MVEANALEELRLTRKVANRKTGGRGKLTKIARSNGSIFARIQSCPRKYDVPASHFCTLSTRCTGMFFAILTSVRNFTSTAPLRTHLRSHPFPAQDYIIIPTEHILSRVNICKTTHVLLIRYLAIMPVCIHFCTVAVPHYRTTAVTLFRIAIFSSL
ncbi:hypothetical protein POVWA2_038050 [Plasmodium ovale wallikeri]|uniref:Uncharacterized protein n=1 Tax=Plasmodium ovale wallikeri TaxID=864142 RepID=A0A1A8Z567_PLAOA|nr:hypothetical protein POVWA1_039090 [Plasmodium ovale wallikeri]SBT39573.1 hypothetical protein POVWA2_038050 [Plasmodium ovale wallikeri]